MLSLFHLSQIIYCDTDSCFILYDPDSPDHKEPCNDAEGRPPGLAFGDGLAQWKDELKGGYITEMVVGGAKSYAYIDNKGKIKITQKGIILDYANSLLFTVEKIKDMVLNDKSIKREERYTFKTDNKTRTIRTDHLGRTVKLTIDRKRAPSGEYHTLPFGYGRD